ncbi:hypothetical protein QBC44DRAFT_359506 [Cladorrhinum sp. PSN332]|nr:hypothetical protein QBC44DRAFT_359506 [Cladorrhinum sp. PSN332]
MASRLIELSCQRFRQSIEVSDDRELQKLSLEDVRQGVLDIQRELRAKQSLRNLDRLTPYLDAAHRYSTAVGHLCNGVPFMPYIWSPLMVILRSVRDQTQALDKILCAYAQIGNALPRLTRYEEAFRGNPDFEHLLAFLFQDITEFHTKALALIRKPAWKMFFVSSWGRFESRFGAILDSISKTSALIDKEAASLNIVDLKEWRQDLLEKAAVAEKRWESEQFQALMKWLETSDREHQSRYDWLSDRACEGTGGWIMSHTKFRSWMRQGSNSPTGILWMNGKPGSGKSVLCSQVVKFLKMGKSRHVLFIFGTRQTHLSAYDIQTHILQAIVAQVVRLNNDMVPLLYDEYLAKAQPSSATVLRRLLAEILPDFEEVRLVVDGVDELPTSEHKPIIKDLLDLVKRSNGTLKLLVSSQDLPSIRPWLEKKPALPLSHEQNLIMRDIGLLVQSSMEDLDESFGGALPDQLREDLVSKILAKADGNIHYNSHAYNIIDKSANRIQGMILWVHLVFSLLRFSSSIQELRACIQGVPPDLKALCSPVQLARVKRIFGWLIFSKDGVRTKKTDVLIGSTICPGTEALDRDSRPFPTSLDICKPLIEDGPHGTVAIVHSTVTEHLLSPESGPFVDRAAANNSLAFACVCQVSRNLELAVAANHSQHLLNVCLGLFGLFDYASEYWTHHLRDAVGPDVQTTIPGQHGRADLNHQINRLRQNYENAVTSMGTPQGAGQYSLPEVGQLGMTQTIANLGAISHIPDLATMLIQVQTITTTETGVLESTGPSSLSKSKSSVFETAESNYRRLVRQILEQQNTQLLPAEEVMAFRQQYATSAYPCPHPACTRRRFGFSSSDELQNHVVTNHSSGFKCYQESCSYNDVGFSSKSSLQAHVRKHHNQSKPRALPQSIRRNHQTPPKQQARMEVRRIPSYQNNGEKEDGVGRSEEAGANEANNAPNLHPLQVHQMQLMLLERENKKRLAMAKGEREINRSGEAGAKEANKAPNLDPLQVHQMQLMLLERENKKRLTMAKGQSEINSNAVEMVNRTAPAGEEISVDGTYLHEKNIDDHAIHKHLTGLPPKAFLDEPWALHDERASTKSQRGSFPLAADRTLKRNFEDPEAFAPEGQVASPEHETHQDQRVPLKDREAQLREFNSTTKRQSEMQQGGMMMAPGIDPYADDSMDPNGEYMHTFPPELLARYPVLASMNWSGNDDGRDREPWNMKPKQDAFTANSAPEPSPMAQQRLQEIQHENISIKALEQRGGYENGVERPRRDVSRLQQEHDELNLTDEPNEQQTKPVSMARGEVGGNESTKRALRDYLMQNALLEQQNAKRMRLARQGEDRKPEQENMGRMMMGREHYAVGSDGMKTANTEVGVPSSESFTFEKHPDQIYWSNAPVSPGQPNAPVADHYVGGSNLHSGPAQSTAGNSSPWELEPSYSSNLIEPPGAPQPNDANIYDMIYGVEAPEKRNFDPSRKTSTNHWPSFDETLRQHPEMAIDRASLELEAVERGYDFTQRRPSPSSTVPDTQPLYSGFVTHDRLALGPVVEGGDPTELPPTLYTGNHTDY